MHSVAKTHKVNCSRDLLGDIEEEDFAGQRLKLK
jgi:hypothetical protein